MEAVQSAQKRRNRTLFRCQAFRTKNRRNERAVSECVRIYKLGSPFRMTNLILAR